MCNFYTFFNILLKKSSVTSHYILESASDCDNLRLKKSNFREKTDFAKKTVFWLFFVCVALIAPDVIFYTFLRKNGQKWSFWPKKWVTFFDIEKMLFCQEHRRAGPLWKFKALKSARFCPQILAYFRPPPQKVENLILVFVCFSQKWWKSDCFEVENEVCHPTFGPAQKFFSKNKFSEKRREKIQKKSLFWPFLVIFSIFRLPKKTLNWGVENDQKTDFFRFFMGPFLTFLHFSDFFQKHV